MPVKGLLKSFGALAGLGFQSADKKGRSDSAARDPRNGEKLLVKRPPLRIDTPIQTFILQRAEETRQEESRAAAAALRGNDDRTRATGELGRACRKLLAPFRIPAASSLSDLAPSGGRG